MTRRPRVLIVDDEADFAEPIAFWLAAKGYPVQRAENGVRALEIIREKPPDIVFLDVNMPEMGGMETLRHIRALSKTLPVIMVTAAFQDETTLTETKALGISGFFPKSESLDRVGAILETALRTLKTPGPPAA